MEYKQFYSLARRLVNEKISRALFILEWGMLQRGQEKRLPVRRGFLCYRTRQTVKGFSRSIRDAVILP